MTRLCTLEECSQLVLPDVHWLIKGYLPKPGMLMILGEARAGKSYLALQVGLALAQGKPILPGTPATAPCKVLYLYFDKMGPFSFKDRLETLSKSGVQIGGSIYCIHPLDKIPSLNILVPYHEQYLRDTLLQVNPDVVICDVIREFHNADENESTQMKVVGDTLSRLFLGRSVILVHHTKKPDPEATEAPRNVDAARGSNYLIGKVDASWQIYKGKLYAESNYDPARIYSLKQSSTGLWIIA